MKMRLQQRKQAFKYCETNDALMTLGITPTFPNTGYGYIECGEASEENISDCYSI